MIQYTVDYSISLRHVASGWAGAVADLENFGGGDDKIYEHKLWIISKFWMFMINVLDLAQTCWGFF